MYRDDQEAALVRAEQATREAERLRRENEAMRAALVRQPASEVPTYLVYPGATIYQFADLRHLPLSERARLSVHTLTRFPVAGAVVLHYLTFGIFSYFYYGAKHGHLPQAASDDPSASKAIGFGFIPYFNLYWMFFNTLRLSDRLSLQFKLRDQPERGPRGLWMTACILQLIPYVGWALAYLVFWPLAIGTTQSRINRLVELPATTFDASLALPPPPGMGPYGPTGAGAANWPR